LTLFAAAWERMPLPQQSRSRRGHDPCRHQAAIHAKIEVHDKRIATLRARAARAGYSLFVIAATDGSSSFPRAEMGPQPRAS